MALRIDKINLKATDVAALPVYGLITTGTNLNTLDGSVYGKYWQSENANSPTSLNYPVAAAGTLLVLKNNASNLATSCTQIYLPYNSNEIYSRSFYSSWTAWSRFASIDMDGANSTIKSLTGLTTALSIEQGGTGVVSKEAFRQSYNVPTKDESLLTENNLSDLADRAAAWLNVRPIGSTPLAGDPVNDYDAVTKRWVENKINTGTVGPTMNGVMNYGVGDFHLRDSRAYIQPYEVVSDGQLLNRADWPELWAYAQMVGAIDDSVWLADVGQRGKYSTGDGTTTFRVPDRNGVQLNSIKGLFARGDGGGDAGQAGSISEAAAPNITGSFPGAIAGAYEEALNRYSSRFGLIGAIGGENGLGAAPGGASKSFAVVNPDNQYGFSFDANLADPVYGRYGIKGTIIPNSFIGVWVIRASGGFIAANTSWSVINGDKTLPANGTSVSGGHVVSDYKVNGVSEGTATFRMIGTIAGNYNARISIYNKAKGTTKTFDFSDNGTVSLPGNVIAAGGGAFRSNIDIVSTSGSANVGFINFRNTTNNATMGAVYSERNGDVTISTSVGGGVGTQKYFQFLQAGNAICSGGWGTGSDERIKEDIQRVPNALREVYTWRGATWVQDFNGKSFGIGLVAQDIEKSCPQAVTRIPEVVKSTGEVVKDVRVIDAGQIAAAYHTEAIRTLFDLLDLALNDPDAARAQVSQLRAELANSK